METNKELELAWRCIEQTGTHLFLTGKAGTGKTTFLQKLKEKSPKRMVVLAPTGVAAINAGGVTIHSFFQFPLGPYIPGVEYFPQRRFKFSKAKVDLIKSLDLLVIDEISMVRADLLDQIDHVLRLYRDKYKPFGGLQLLMIGDIHQLAPIVSDDEKELLNSYYECVYFFGSKALRQTPFVCIELQHIYRQSDLKFISLLNDIRNSNPNFDTLKAINQRYIPLFNPSDEENYIRLTTHNFMAQDINEQKMTEIEAPIFRFKAQIEGNFPKNLYPADEELYLKLGAQVMFLKNDNIEQRYFNGKLGKITDISEEYIEVLGIGDKKPFIVSIARWDNSKYVIDEESKAIKEEIEGYFNQYPLRLAWAITIHKSQGLTFDRVIIDAASAFTHGQVYVALSRCRSLEGIVLNRPINAHCIINDRQVDLFTKESEKLTPDEAIMCKLERDYFFHLLNEQFTFKSLGNALAKYTSYLKQHLFKMYPSLSITCDETCFAFKDKIINVSDIFRNKYTPLINQIEDFKTNKSLHKRFNAAACYFNETIKELLTPLLPQLRIDIGNKEVANKVVDTIKQIEQFYREKSDTLTYLQNNNFSVLEYLQIKSKAIINEQKNEINNEEPALETTKKTKKSITKNNQNKEAKKETEKSKVATPPFKQIVDDLLNPYLFEALREWRIKKAKTDGVQEFTILQQKTIIDISNKLPKDKNELMAIWGIGEKKIAAYGEEILAIVKNYVEEKVVEE